MDPDPRIHASNYWIRIRILLFPSFTFKDASKKLIFNTIFPAFYFLKLHLHHFSKIKSQKESRNSRNQGFSYYFCMMIQGSESGSRAGSGSIPRTSGSGSGGPKNMWIRMQRADSNQRENKTMQIRETAWKITVFRSSIRKFSDLLDPDP